MEKLIATRRFSPDSSLEGNGFELSVPRMMGGRFSTKGISGNRDDQHLARARDNNFDLDGPGPHRAKSAGQRLRFAGAARNNQGHGEETRRAHMTTWSVTPWYILKPVKKLPSLRRPAVVH